MAPSIIRRTDRVWLSGDRARRSLAVSLVGALLAVFLIVANSAGASAGPIISAGPLTRIAISPSLNCAVDHVDDLDPAFFGESACLTAMAVGSELYRPGVVPGSEPILGGTPWLVYDNSQTGPIGVGTADDPYVVTSRALTADSGLRVFQVDTYRVGEESWRTDVSVVNETSAAVEATVYRAGDCNLQNSDFGFGSYDPATGAVACRAVADPNSEEPVPGARIEQWTPITPGSKAFEGSVETLWGTIAARQPFDDSCTCDEYLDNGAGLSWTVSVPPRAFTTISSLVTISPSGSEPLTTSVVSDEPTSPIGGSNGYSITLSNPNEDVASVQSISQVLPSGFDYIAGSTSGALTTDPTIDGRRLSWAGPLSVPPNGSVTLRLAVRVADSPGRYTTDVSADALGRTVVSAEDVAPIEVTDVVGNLPPTVDAGPDLAVQEGTPVSIGGSVVDGDSLGVTSVWSVGAGAGADPGAACVVSDPSDPASSLVCNDDGTFELTLTADDGVNPSVADSVSVVVTNADPQLVVPPPGSGVVGQSVKVSTPASDPGSNDSLLCTFEWSDGTPATSSASESGVCAAEHTFTTPGVKTVGVSVADDDGGSSATSTPVTINEPSTDGQRVSVAFRGAFQYTNEADVDPGSIRVVRDAAGTVTRVLGTTAMPGVQSATLTLTVDLTKAGPFDTWIGTVAWSDGPFDGAVPVWTRLVKSNAEAVMITTYWLAGRAPFRTYRIDLRIAG